MPPTCVKCNLEMRCKKNAILLEHMTNDGPYQVFSADLWECPECHFEVVSGVARTPRLEAFMPNYEESVEEIVKAEQTVRIRQWSAPQWKKEYHERTNQHTT